MKAWLILGTVFCIVGIPLFAIYGFKYIPDERDRVADKEAQEIEREQEEAEEAQARGEEYRAQAAQYLEVECHPTDWDVSEWNCTYSTETCSSHCSYPDCDILWGTVGMEGGCCVPHSDCCVRKCCQACYKEECSYVTTTRSDGGMNHERKCKNVYDHCCERVCCEDGVNRYYVHWGLCYRVTLNYTAFVSALNLSLVVTDYNSCGFEGTRCVELTSGTHEDGVRRRCWYNTKLEHVVFENKYVEPYVESYLPSPLPPISSDIEHLRTVFGFGIAFMALGAAVCAVASCCVER